METDLKGKIALVTGSGSGIGKAISLGLAKEGADIIINCLNLKHAEATASEVKGLGCRAIIALADVSNETAANEMVDKVVHEWGGIDILVNNAGVASLIMVEDMTKADWDKVMEVNLGGTFNCSRAVIETMKKRGGGAIINIASFAGKRMSMISGANYSASKAGILGFTRHLAYEVGPYKITVNAVCPGHVITPLLEKGTTPEFREKLKQQYPLGKLPTPEDIADAVVFLASCRARMITGTSIDVDGGVTLGVGHAGYDDYVARKKEALKKLRGTK